MDEARSQLVTADHTGKVVHQFFCLGHQLFVERQIDRTLSYLIALYGFHGTPPYAHCRYL